MIKPLESLLVVLYLYKFGFNDTTQILSRFVGLE